MNILFFPIYMFVDFSSVFCSFQHTKSIYVVLDFHLGISHFLDRLDGMFPGYKFFCVWQKHIILKLPPQPFWNIQFSSVKHLHITGSPCLQKFTLCLFAFTKHLPFFTNWKKSEQNFHFYEIIASSFYTNLASKNVL